MKIAHKQKLPWKKCQICVVIFPRYLFKNVHRYLWQYFKLRDILPNCTGSLGSKLKDTKSFIKFDFGAICEKREF